MVRMVLQFWLLDNIFGQFRTREERALSVIEGDDIRYQKDFIFFVTIVFRIHFFNNILARSVEKHFISLITVSFNAGK